MKYIGCAVTDVGINKKTNQDSICLKIANTKKYGQIVMVVLCDGMGGLSKGELASATVIRKFEDWFMNQLPKQLDSYSWENLSIEWEEMIHEQNQEIGQYGKKIGASLGTTLTAILIIEEKYMIVHVGDSRVYCLDQYVSQLTEDQTFVAREVRRGNMTAEQAKIDVRRNVLLQCIGASRAVVPQILFGEVRANTIYMLCSDGFRHEITEKDMFEYLAPNQLNSIEDMQKNSTYLIDLVKKRREKDNISVALIKCIE